MSQTDGGDFSGARPKDNQDNQDSSVACGNSLTHITLGAGTAAPQQPQYSQHSGHVHPPQLHQQQARPFYGLPRSGQGIAVPGGVFEQRTFNRAPPPQPPQLHQHQQHHAQQQHHHAGSHQQDFLAPPQVYDNSMLLKEQGEHDFDDQEDRDGGDYDDAGDGNSQGSGKRSRTRRPHLQGRFSGRLTTKEDERRLAEECKLLGPLLGGVGKRGDKSRLTLAKIVRGIATGDVRRFCEERERGIALLKQKLAAMDPEAAASVPVNPIAIPSAGMGGMGGLGGLGGGSMGAPSSMGAMGAVDALQRENAELQHEVYGLRSELQARERLLLELQDTGIISGFVPTSIPLDDAHHRALAAAHHHPASHHSGGHHHHHHGGGGGHVDGGGGGRAMSADMAPPAGYGMAPAARPNSYGHPHAGSYGAGPSQMSMPQSSGMDAAPAPGMGGPGGMGVAGGPPGGGGGMGGMVPGPAPSGGMGGTGGGGGGGDSVSMGSMPAVSEASRASRSLKRGPQDLVGGPMVGGGGGGVDVPRSLSQPAPGRGGGGGGGYLAAVDLQAQLNTLQAQVEHLQNMSAGAAQGSTRSGGSLLMPARERNQGALGRLSAGPAFGGAGSGLSSPFVPAHSGGGPQSGMLMMQGSHPGEASHSFHPGLGAPMHMQLLKQQQPGLYDMGVRDPRGAAAAAAGPGGPGNGGGGAEAAEAYGLDASFINSRAMRGDFDLPMDLLLHEGGDRGGANGAAQQ